MVEIARGQPDAIVLRIQKMLEKYGADHPRAKISLYRRGSFSVRIRIIDPEFKGVSRSDRHRIVWKYLDELDDEAEADICMLVPLTPDETERSGSNLEFEDPTPLVL